MAAVVKPRGLPMQSHPADAAIPSLEAGLPFVLRRVMHVPGALPFPQHVHRLDLPTGALTFAFGLTLNKPVEPLRTLNTARFILSLTSPPRESALRWCRP
jgi:hypothetical protein